jgi:glycosyltransferase involved in cell wall biosynthesis
MTVNQTPPIKILSLVEATTVNAVAKNVMEFHRAARELHEQARDFPKIEACIVTFERKREPGQSPNAFAETAREQELEVAVIPERRRFDLSAIPALKRLVDEQRPDIIVTHSVKSHFLLWRSQLWRKYPWVAFHHGYTTTDLKMRAYNWLDRWSLPKADHLITVCRAFALELASTSGVALEEISVRHNSVRPKPNVVLDEARSLKTRLGIANGERIVLTVGRLSREKAQIDLLAAYNHLLSTKTDLSIRLIMVGDGPERARLESAAQAYGFKERVIFTGQMTDVQLFYAAADVFVLPSHSEGSPNVLLEAMAANLPIVATDVGGVAEIVENNESALLVPPNDPDALATAIVRVLTDNELRQRLTTNASMLVATNYTPENYVRSLTDIYREVIHRRAG